VVGVSGSLYVNGQRQLKADAETVDRQRQAAREYNGRVAAGRREREEAKPTVPVDATVIGVRIRHLGWFRVKRVNKTTVTVVVASNEHTGAEATARYPLVDVVAVAR
jgi:hypothetical protein